MKLDRKHSDSVIFSAESSDTLTDEDVEVDKEDEIEGIGEVFSSETEVRKILALFGAYSVRYFIEGSRE